MQWVCACECVSVWIIEREKEYVGNNNQNDCEGEREWNKQ